MVKKQKCAWQNMRIFCTAHHHTERPIDNKERNSTDRPTKHAPPF